MRVLDALGGLVGREVGIFRNIAQLLRRRLRGLHEQLQGGAEGLAVGGGGGAIQYGGEGHLDYTVGRNAEAVAVFHSEDEAGIVGSGGVSK